MLRLILFETTDAANAPKLSNIHLLSKPLKGLTQVRAEGIKL